MKRLLTAALRYGLVGLLNTAVGYGVILALDLGLKVNPFAANTAGYVVGLVLGYVLSRRFVFRTEQSNRATGPRYLIAVAACFALNQAVLGVSRSLLPDAPLGHALSQLAGMASYTAALFALSYVWVFRARPTATTES